MPRDYKDEYRKFQSSDGEKKRRALRNKARRDAGLKKGDGREVDHIKPLIKGGGTGDGNTRVVSRKTNRAKGKK